MHAHVTRALDVGHRIVTDKQDLFGLELRFCEHVTKGFWIGFERAEFARSKALLEEMLQTDDIEIGIAVGKAEQPIAGAEFRQRVFGVLVQSDRVTRAKKNCESFLRK